MSQLSPQQLYALILSDAIALQHLNTANDDLCARRCTEIAPPYPKELKLSFAGVLRLYKDNPTKGSFINEKLRNLAETNALFKDIVDFMSHYTPSESYPDFSLAPIRQALTTPESQGGAGFTQEQVQRILDAGIQRDHVHPLEVELVRCQLHIR